ncbi:MAG: DUF2946 family protein, partial [Burkholderiales bacterium]|nr:DUF2946 family protein [Burkholderiales bacterium]
MDDIVKAAMAKWPNVPHCYGWLALDARGTWRMRDERCQAMNLAGDPIRHSSLLGFINRNYQHDDQGQWYFQNGPQRVYVDLETTPYIARTSDCGFTLHNNEAMPLPEHVYLDASGHLILQSKAMLAQLDDRDLAECLSLLYTGDAIVSDEQLLAWMNRQAPTLQLTLQLPGNDHLRIPVQHAE